MSVWLIWKKFSTISIVIINLYEQSPHPWTLSLSTQVLSINIRYYLVLTEYETNNLTISGNSTIRFLSTFYKLWSTLKVSELVHKFDKCLKIPNSFTLVWRECQFKAKYLKNYAFRREKCRHFELNHPPLHCWCCLLSVLNRVECCLLRFDDILGPTFKMKN